MPLSDDFNAIPKLFGDAVEQLGKLVQNEALLARAELSQKITQAGIGAAYIAGAAILCIPVVMMLLMALAIWFISVGLSPVQGYAASALIGAVVAGALGAMGRSYFKAANLKPKVTLQQMQRDVTTAKELAR